MSKLRIRLSTGMLLIAFAAPNLYAIRLVFIPGSEGPQFRYFVLSALPMIDVSAVLGYRLANRRDRPSPFAVGFLVSGIVALAVQVALQFFIPSVGHMYDAAARAFLEICLAYSIPGSIAMRRDGTGFFRYAPALSLLYASPQFMVGLLGGVAAWFAAWRSNRRFAA